MKKTRTSSDFMLRRIGLPVEERMHLSLVRVKCNVQSKNSYHVLRIDSMDRTKYKLQK